MGTKSKWKSKTLWFNAIMLVGALAGELTKVLPFTAETNATLLTINIIANKILRFMTNTGLK